jgi:hypothetical protein
MLVLFTSALFLILCGAILLQFILKMRSLRSAEARSASSLAADRYRPMLRLLSNDDLALAPTDRKMRKAFRARRRELFRGYLRYLTRDYAHLLAGVRSAMVQSGADRPDLARAIAKNRVLFAIATCKIEFSLALHAAGVGKVDISGLVEALETLRSQVSVLSAASFSNASLSR